MSDKMVIKATLAERVNHWLLAASFFVVAVTGIGFAFHGLNWLNTLFGGNAAASIVHKAAGVVFLASLLVTVLSYLGESVTFGPEDAAWLRLRGGYLDPRAKLPPQGRLNLGQKLFYLLVLAGGILISATGFVLWLESGGRAGMIYGHFLHYAFFLLLAVTVPAHVYLTTAANPGTLRIMTRGTVPLAWAKRHHGKWVKKMGFDD